MSSYFTRIKPSYYYISISIVIVCATLAYLFTGSAYTQVRNTNPTASRDALLWSEPPSEIQEKWHLEEAQGLIDTPGATVAVFDNELRRIDSETGDTMWSYMPSGSVCDATEHNGNVVALTNEGNGCSAVFMLDSSTGEFMKTAQYATEEDVAKLRADAGYIAIVTPKHVRIMRDDLVTTSEFGDQIAPLYSTDQHYTDCTISDVVMSPEKYAVAAQCFNTSLGQRENNYNIKINDIDPEESAQADEVFNIDTGSAQPVTLPIMTRAMIQFVTAGNETSAYTWEVTKGQSLVTREFKNFGDHGFPYQDFEGIGLVWRVGNTLNYRYGSEDLTNPTQVEGAIGNVMTAGNVMLVPLANAVRYWNPTIDVDHTITVPGLRGQEFAFSGRTVMSIDDQGTIRGYN